MKCKFEALSSNVVGATNFYSSTLSYNFFDFKWRDNVTIYITILEELRNNYSPKLFLILDDSNIMKDVDSSNT